MSEYEVVEADLSPQEGRHVHLVGVQGAEQDLERGWTHETYTVSCCRIQGGGWEAKRKGRIAGVSRGEE